MLLGRNEIDRLEESLPNPVVRSVLKPSQCQRTQTRDFVTQKFSEKVLRVFKVTIFLSLWQLSKTGDTTRMWSMVTFSNCDRAHFPSFVNPQSFSDKKHSSLRRNLPNKGHVFLTLYPDEPDGRCPQQVSSLLVGQKRNSPLSAKKTEIGKRDVSVFSARCGISCFLAKLLRRLAVHPRDSKFLFSPSPPFLLRPSRSLSLSNSL